MPSENERPRAPDVAMPPTPDPASSRTRAIDQPAPRRAKIRPQRRCRACGLGVISTAMSPPSLTKARSSGAAAVISASSSSATAPATAAIGVTNTSANGRQASHHPPRHRALDARSLVHRRAQRRQLVAQLRQDPREAACRPPRRPRAPRRACPHAFSTTSIGPCDRCRRSPVKLLDHRRREHGHHPILASASHQRVGLGRRQRLQRAARHLGRRRLHLQHRGAARRGERQQHEPGVARIRSTGARSPARSAGRRRPRWWRGPCASGVPAGSATPSPGRRAWPARRTASASPQSAP